MPVSVRLSEPIGFPMTLPSGFSPAARSGSAPLEVCLRRGSITESVHRAHAVVCDGRGRVLMSAGNPGMESFIRSALKPFQALPFLSSGTADQLDVDERGIAISCASHVGTNAHAREAFRLLWKAELESSSLQCPVPKGADSPLSTIVPVSTLPSWPLVERWAGRSRPISSRTTLSRSK